MVNLTLEKIKRELKRELELENKLLNDIINVIFVHTLKVSLKEGHCILCFCPRTRPKTFLQCFAVEQRESKAKHCRNVLGRKDYV